MSEFYDTSGNKIVLSRKIGVGGEGTVFFVEDSSEVVAKLYHEAPDEEKLRKLEWMHEHRKDDFASFSAWVVDLLFDKPGGSLVGFLMPHVDAKEIHELYSLKSRKVYFPHATWHFLLHASANIARAFFSLHAHDHLMGDVNHGNCVVRRDGTVKLIDCDSFGINTKDSEYFCDVGVATHLAPELQGRDLSTTPRTAEHDNFGLAVMIFQLLFLGRHPFAGNVKGEFDLSLEECIKNGFFAYGDDNRIQQPPGTLRLDDLPAKLGELFTRAFTSQTGRPTPKEWVESLEDVLKNLKQCAEFPGHQYPTQIAACPWCRIEAQTGLLLFPFISTDVAKREAKPFDIITVEQIIRDLEDPKALTGLDRVGRDLPEPSQEVAAAAANLKKIRVGLVGGLFTIVMIAMLMFGVGGAGMVGFVLLIPFILIATTSNNKLRNSLLDQIRTKQIELSRASKKIENITERPGAKEAIDRARQKLDHYKILNSQFESKANPDDLKPIQAELQRIPIPESVLSPLVDDSRRMLRSNGLATAADITLENLNKVPHIKEETKGTLVSWRNYVAGNIYENDSDEKTTALSLPDPVRSIEYEIRILLRKLNVLSDNKSRTFGSLREGVNQHQVEFDQLSVDLKRLGDGALTVALLFVVAVFTPVVGAIGAEMLRSDTVPTTIEEDADTIYSEDLTTGNGRGLGSNTFRVTGAPFVVVEGFDEEARRERAMEAYDRGQELFVRKSYLEAAKSFDIAGQYMPETKKYLDLAGEASYLGGNYAGAVAMFEKSLSLEDSTYTASYLAHSYYAKADLDKAIRLYKSVVTRTNASADYLGLGAAQKDAGNLSEAQDAFQMAVRLSPKNVDAHYALGILYFNQNKLADARKQYNRIKELDSNRARDFFLQTGLADKGLVGTTKDTGTVDGTGNGIADGRIRSTKSSGGIAGGRPANPRPRRR